MFVLGLSRWYNTLKQKEEDKKQEEMNFAMLKENEERDECLGKKRELSSPNVADYNALSHVRSLTISEVAKLSDFAYLRLIDDQINSDNDNDADEFLSVSATSYESIHELEQQISDEESSLPTSTNQGLRTMEESVVNGNIRKSNEKPLDSTNIEGEFTSEIAGFTNILQENLYLADIVSPPSLWNNELSYKRGLERNPNATESEFKIEDSLPDRKLKTRNDRFDHGLDTVPFINHGEGNVDGSIYPNLSSEYLLYDGESFVHMDSGSVASAFEPQISICSVSNEQIYDVKLANLIPEENDLFLSCYDTLFENGNDKETSLIILSR